ncbi:MAG: DNA polymerase Y family protein [Gammaproteobacteria bacterium]|nr:DNA polymerase Y family protein [Pseudomonadales bacterium]MCP5348132.1 DNA polymerase Y family protein [Pseudomonadales bacterium]
MKKPEPTLPLPAPKAAARGQAARGQVVQMPGRAKPPLAEAKAGKTSRSLWYALYLPQLLELPEPLQQQRLKQLAALARGVSSGISFHPGALVLEIRSSLRYFRGIDRLHEILAAGVTRQLQSWQLPESFRYAAAPTVTGSLLLARGGHNRLVYRRDNLRSALGGLSTDVLELSREQRRRLYNMGVRRLRDLWRLPAAGLRKRFGSSFVDQLFKAVGERPEPQHYYQPPPAFRCSYDLPCEVDNVSLLLPVVEEFLAQLVDFLRRRDLSTSRLALSLVHERQADTRIILGLRQPSRCPRHLLQLLQLHLDSLSLPAPVVTVTMQVKRFDAHAGESDPLLPGGQPGSGGQADYGDERLDRFLEQLQARLGERHIHRINNVADHCPDYATRQLNPLHSPVRPGCRETASNPRPFWLLPAPRPLEVRGGRLYYRRAVSILSGPERIETRWWSGTDVRRDYYVAREECGSRLWIYREKTGERGWYLHGIFA